MNKTPRLSSEFCFANSFGFNSSDLSLTNRMTEGVAYQFPMSLLCNIL